MDCDVVVVGAGLAGLRCAHALAGAGLAVEVWEAADGVGGRVRTDHEDGHLLDRGFQVLNPAYPAVRRWVDVAALDLGRFAAGVAVRRADRLVVAADPRRAPRHLPATLRSGYVRPAELIALARWAAPALGPVGRLLAADDTTLRRSLDAARVRGRIRQEVLEPFLQGVLLEADGSTSATFARLLVRMFLLGTPGLPAAGMGALPAQLAARLDGPVHLGLRVHEVAPVPGGVRVSAEGRRVTARAAVVATDPVSAAALTGVPAPPMKGLVTDWFTTDEAPTTLPMLVLDGRDRAGVGSPGPVVNGLIRIEGVVGV